MTPLERAARAVVAAEQGQWDLPAEEWDRDTLERHGIIKIARAVLMSVREPGPFKLSIATQVWCEGIDAILATEPTAPTDVDAS